MNVRTNRTTSVHNENFNTTELQSEYYKVVHVCQSVSRENLQEKVMYMQPWTNATKLEDAKFMSAFNAYIKKQMDAYFSMLAVQLVKVTKLW